MKYTPSQLITYYKNSFVAWMMKASKISPERYPTPPVSDEDQLIFDKGMNHEKTYLQSLIDEGLDVFNVEDFIESERCNKTLEAMKSGCPVIYQAELSNNAFYGKADFLLRINQPSQLGNFSYIVADTKLSKKSKPEHLLQMCVYAEILEEIQGVLPETIQVVLGDKSIQAFETKEIWESYCLIRNEFIEFNQKFDIDNPPVPIQSGSYGAWDEYVENYFKQVDHLFKVANITTGQVKKLNSAGILTMSQLVDTNYEEVEKNCKLAQVTYEKLQLQASLQKETETLGEIQFRIRPHQLARKGFEVLPPPSQNDIFFDIEGDPLIEGGLEYLFGVSFFQQNSLSYKDWWAHNAFEEKQMVENFLDWCQARFQADPNMHIYHYAPYEITALKRLTNQYSTREEILDDFLRKEVFVDLYRVVSQGVCIGLPSYSIKAVEQLYRTKRAGDVQNAGASIVMYEKWLLEPDGYDCSESEMLSAIRDYNKDDTDSTLELANWLWNQQKISGISYIPFKTDGADDSQGNKTDIKARSLQEENLRNELLSAFSIDESLLTQPQEMSEEQKVALLLSQVVSFFRREDKPFWWTYFDRLTKTNEELFADDSCIAMAKRNPESGKPFKQSRIISFNFDPEQEVKMKEAEKCRLFFGDDYLHGSMSSLDLDRGYFEFMVAEKQLTSKKFDSLPHSQNFLLVPFSFISKQPITDSIERVIKKYIKEKKLKPCLEQFLTKASPVVKNLEKGKPLLTSESSSVDEIVSLAMNLQNACLCIQGPPGTGKTYTATKIIAKAISSGLKVGITANSHKVINNLMLKVSMELEQNSFALNGVKVSGDEDGDLKNAQNIKVVTTLGSDFEKYNLIGGTTWVFSKPEIEGNLDLLIVDEAGQIGSPHLIAISPSAQNIILLGDQMQLSQPTQGIHPGSVGLSALEYYLEGKATVPPEKGVFLNQSYRLNPKIADFISQIAYDGRLKTPEDNLKQMILFSEEADILQEMGQNAGVTFLPVAHTGNTVASDEEVEVIKALCDELLQCDFQTSSGELKRLEVKDILCVTPYNIQRLNLQGKLGSEYRVGTVDKFQGQEAPVVIVSLCASNLSEAPRGIDFLLDKNRLNVAVSRAKALAIVIGSPDLLTLTCKTIPQLKMVNPFAFLVRHHLASCQRFLIPVEHSLK